MNKQLTITIILALLAILPSLLKMGGVLWFATLGWATVLAPIWIPIVFLVSWISTVIVLVLIFGEKE